MTKMIDECELCGELDRVWLCEHHQDGRIFHIWSCSECTDIISLRLDGRIIEGEN